MDGSRVFSPREHTSLCLRGLFDDTVAPLLKARKNSQAFAVAVLGTHVSPPVLLSRHLAQK